MEQLAFFYFLKGRKVNGNFDTVVKLTEIGQTFLVQHKLRLEISVRSFQTANTCARTKTLRVNSLCTFVIFTWHSRHLQLSVWEQLRPRMAAASSYKSKLFRLLLLFAVSVEFVWLMLDDEHLLLSGFDFVSWVGIVFVVLLCMKNWKKNFGVNEQTRWHKFE